MGMFVHFKFTVLELLLLCRANWVTIDGTLYKKPCAVLVKVNAELELPLFGQRIRCLFTSTLKFSTLHIFDSHFHCYVVQPTRNTSTDTVWPYRIQNARYSPAVSAMCVVPLFAAISVFCFVVSSATVQ